MRRLLAFLLPVALLGAASPAQAQTVLFGSDGPTQTLYQSWIDAALVRTPDVRVRLRLEPCPDATDGRWCEGGAGGVPTIWTDGDPARFWDVASFSPEHVAAIQLWARLVLLHEVGHVFDYTPRHHAYRKRFWHIMRYRHGIWQDAKDRHGRRVQPDEQFAMAYSYCSASLHWAGSEVVRRVDPGYRYRPTAEQYERVCRLLATQS